MGFGNTVAPLSRDILQQYIASADKDIYSAKKLRLMIELKPSNETVGMTDLYDFDPRNRRAGIGIMVATEHQKNELASHALTCLIAYASSLLNLSRVFRAKML